jgi:hypothetical protein
MLNYTDNKQTMRAPNSPKKTQSLKEKNNSATTNEAYEFIRIGIQNVKKKKEEEEEEEETKQEKEGKQK